jgi:hypothetical protein
MCLHRIWALKGALSGKVHKAHHKKIKKPGTSVDPRWTWLQMSRGPKHKAVKLQGPKQKMRKLVRQVPLSNSWRKWRQGPTWRGVEIKKNAGGFGKQAGAEPGWSGPRPVGPGRRAQPILDPVQCPLRPSTPSGYLKTPRKVSRRNSFVIRRRGAEKLAGHHLEEEGRASCLGFP